MEQFTTPFDTLPDAFRSWRREFPHAASVDAVEFFKGSWRRQGWLDQRLAKWPARKANTKRSRGRAILVQTGKLRRSIMPKHDRDHIGAVSRLPYAAVHNQGLRAGRGKGFKMRKRQFMGHSAALMDTLEQKIFEDLDGMF